MDDRRFDALARLASTAPSRRRLLAGLFAALGLAGADAADAKPGGEGKGGGRPGGKGHGRNRGNGHGNGRNRKGKRCDPKPDSEVCKGRCGPRRNNCGNRVECGGCPGGGCCDGGVCVAETACCPSGGQCVAGSCGAPEATLADCGGRCDCDESCSGSPIPANVELCGQTVACPPCDPACEEAGCPSATMLDGPYGQAVYCNDGGTGTGGCSSCPAGTYCHPADTRPEGVCRTICTGA
jgi:hypothetical protein